MNGQEVSTVWCTPWEANLTPFVKNGENKLEIEVVNSLMNRMIGDASLPESKRLTYSYPEIAKSTDGLVILELQVKCGWYVAFYNVLIK